MKFYECPKCGYAAITYAWKGCKCTHCKQKVALRYTFDCVWCEVHWYEEGTMCIDHARFMA